MSCYACNPEVSTLEILAWPCLWLVELIENECRAGRCGVCTLEYSGVALFAVDLIEHVMLVVVEYAPWTILVWPCLGLIELIENECRAGRGGVCTLEYSGVALFAVDLTANRMSCWSLRSIHIGKYWCGLVCSWFDCKLNVLLVTAEYPHW